MKRKVFIGCLSLTLLLPLASPSNAEELSNSADAELPIVSSNQVINDIQDSGISVIIDGIRQEYAVAPFIENGTTLVPMRSIFETFGAEVKWIEHIKTVRASKKELNVEIRIGSYFAKINDETIKLDAQPRLVEGVTMVPLRFVSEAFGALVEWDEDSRTIEITRSQPQKQNQEAEVEEKVTKDEQPGSSNESAGNVDNVLTYEHAVELALKQSYKLKNENESIKRTEKVRETLADSFMYSAPEGHGLGPADLMAREALLRLAQTDIGLGQAKRQINITEEAIAFQVKDAMDEIVKTETELSFTELDLKNTERQLELARLKTENGIESEFNLNAVKRTLEEGRKQKEVLLKSLDKAYLRLNQLIGKKDDERYEIAESVTFEPLKVADLDAHVHRVTSQDPYVWLQEKNIEQAELGLTLYTYNAGQEPYAAKEIDVRTEKNKLMDLKSRLDESIRTKFNDLEQLEKQFEVLEVNLKKAEDGLNLVRTQYDAGMAIDAQLEDAQLAVEKIKTELTKLVFTHEKLKILFNKPYLAPDYL